MGNTLSAMAKTVSQRMMMANSATSIHTSPTRTRREMMLTTPTPSNINMHMFSQSSTSTHHRPTPSFICQGTKAKKSHLGNRHGKQRKAGERGKKKDRVLAACYYCNSNRNVASLEWYEIPDEMDKHYIKRHINIARTVATIGNSIFNECDKCYNKFRDMETGMKHWRVCDSEGWVRTF